MERKGKMCIQAFLRSIKAKAKLWCMNRYTKKIDKEKTQKMIAISNIAQRKYNRYIKIRQKLQYIFFILLM